MAHKREHRARIEIRAATIDGKPGVTLHVIRPGVVDDYGSVWKADAFDHALSERMPTLCWSHDWSEPLGPAVGFRSSPDGPEVDFAFSDFAAVPQARRAHAQVLDGTIADCSVGFSNARRREPTTEERTRFPGVVEVIEEADLDEVSLVLRGAVPGAKVVSARGAKVELDAVVELGRRVVAGELTEDEARAALELLGTQDPPPGAGEDGSGSPDADGDPAAELDEAEAAADAAMEAAFGRSAPR
jgi:HK97 family phage prohead protease